MLSFVLAVLMSQPQDKFLIKRGFVIENNQRVATLPKMVSVPKFLRMKEKSVLADIVNACDNGLNQPVLNNSRKTNGHETTHMVQANMRNNHGGRVNAFYLLDGKGVILKEPGIAKRLVQKFVPPSLRQSRYETYVSGQTAWDDCPLYLVDEWNAYINGTMVAVDDKEQGIADGNERSDEAVDPIEMGVYCVALAMAVEKHDRQYWDSEPEFKAFMLYEWQRAKEVFDKAAPLFPWDTQDAILKSLRESPDAEDMRQFIKTHLNGVWLNP